MICMVKGVRGFRWKDGWIVNFYMDGIWLGARGSPSQRRVTKVRTEGGVVVVAS